MVFRTEPHIQRARDHLASDERQRLVYASLELRFALERIAYQKLQLRLDKITFEEIGAWQPKRAMDQLMELVDDHLPKDAVLRMAPDNSQGKAEAEDFITIGANRGVNPRDIGRYWQKLGSYLHAQVPKKKGDNPKDFDETALRAFLQEVISYVEAVTSTRFDFHFSESITFTCDKCKQSIVRNSKLLKDGSIVQCQNPNCIVSYEVQKRGDDFAFKPYLLDFKCLACGHEHVIEANALLKLGKHEAKILACNACEAKHIVNWTLQIGPYSGEAPAANARARSA